MPVPNVGHSESFCLFLPSDSLEMNVLALAKPHPQESEVPDLPVLEFRERFLSSKSPANTRSQLELKVRASLASLYPSSSLGYQISF